MRSAVAGVLAVAWLLPGLARAEGWAGYGPLPVRNFQPIQLIFLNLPFERAAVLRPGAFAVRLETAESNEIATEQGDVEALLKFETNRTVLGASIGVYSRLEVGVDVPMISRFGGFMDPLINGVEGLFGQVNPERELFPDNVFGGFSVSRFGTELFDGPKQQFELGDIWFSTKYELWRPARLPLLSVRGAVKAPTGSASGVFGSGNPDVGLGFAAEYQACSWLMLYQNLAVIFPVGPITAGNLSLDPFATEGFGFELRLADWASFLFQQEAYSSPMHGTGTPILDGTAVELAAGFNLAWRRWLLQLGAINNVSGVATAADFTLYLRLTYSGELWAASQPVPTPTGAAPST